jgi:ABC-2 type transport system permease protein
MNAFAQTWGALLPLRWYMAVLLGQAARGLPLPIPRGRSPRWRRSPCSTRCSRCCACARSQEAPPRRPRRTGGRLPRRAASAEPSPPNGGACSRSAAPSSAGGGAVIYGIYYPQPYLNQILRKIPIAVVDNDLSELSRASCRPGCERRGQRGGAAETLAEARGARSRRGLRGGRHPAGTERDVLKGITAHLRSMPMPPTCSSSDRRQRHRLAINTLSSELAAGGARTDGSLVKATLARTSPADILLQPIFNPVGGYASYIVPAAFVLILQQMLLIVAVNADRCGGYRSLPVGRS